MDAIAAASQQFTAAPLVAVFDFGYGEIHRQVTKRGSIANPVALERTLQLGISEEITKLERNMSWLATAATVLAVRGLIRHGIRHHRSFPGPGPVRFHQHAHRRPGIANALFATALGLFAAIPAAVFYNYFGNSIKVMGTRMEDFSLEFLNAAERMFEG